MQCKHFTKVWPLVMALITTINAAYKLPSGDKTELRNWTKPHWTGQNRHAVWKTFTFKHCNNLLVNGTTLKKSTHRWFVNGLIGGLAVWLTEIVTMSPLRPTGPLLPGSPCGPCDERTESQKPIHREQHYDSLSLAQFPLAYMYILHFNMQYTHMQAWFSWRSHWSRRSLFSLQAHNEETAVRGHLRQLSMLTTL